MGEPRQEKRRRRRDRALLRGNLRGIKRPALFTSRQTQSWHLVRVLGALQRGQDVEFLRKELAGQGIRRKIAAIGCLAPGKELTALLTPVPATSLGRLLYVAEDPLYYTERETALLALMTLWETERLEESGTWWLVRSRWHPDPASAGRLFWTPLPGEWAEERYLLVGALLSDGTDPQLALDIASNI
jgi:hypothetical protein